MSLLSLQTKIGNGLIFFCSAIIIPVVEQPQVYRKYGSHGEIRRDVCGRDRGWLRSIEVLRISHTLTYLFTYRSEAVSELMRGVSSKTLRSALRSPWILEVSAGFERAMPLAAHGLDCVWDNRNAEHSRDRSWLLPSGLIRCLSSMLSLHQVHLGFPDNISLGQPRRR